MTNPRMRATVQHEKIRYEYRDDEIRVAVIPTSNELDIRCDADDYERVRNSAAGRHTWFISDAGRTETRPNRWYARIESATKGKPIPVAWLVLDIFGEDGMQVQYDQSDTLNLCGDRIRPRGKLDNPKIQAWMERKGIKPPEPRTEAQTKRDVKQLANIAARDKS